MVAQETGDNERRVEMYFRLDTVSGRGVRGESVDLNCSISMVYARCSSSHVKGVVTLYIDFNDIYNK